MTVYKPSLNFILNSKCVNKTFLSFSSRPSNFMLKITLTIKRHIDQIVSKFSKMCQKRNSPFFDVFTNRIIRFLRKFKEKICVT